MILVLMYRTCVLQLAFAASSKNISLSLNYSDKQGTSFVLVRFEVRMLSDTE